ncbi:uncharacterized protein LOC129740294 [Uranotaenia lowii]|uniref:uncharacterized protein LOC129740294 n=1 Tax=Uranotaenia lowii TaxID=190385 RepID=UPI00247A7BE0|nr:uncharacterized protein LOC129740294 [Uranotaenia lowii]
MMAFTTKVFILCGLLVLTNAQFESWQEYDEADSAPSDEGLVRGFRPPYYPVKPQQSNPAAIPSAVVQPSAVVLARLQHAIDLQNRALGRLFAQSFRADTPPQFREAIVQLYVRCQRELDLCAEFLWESLLLPEYRRCANMSRRSAWRQIVVLAGDIRALTAASPSVQLVNGGAQPASVSGL